MQEERGQWGAADKAGVGESHWAQNTRSEAVRVLLRTGGGNCGERSELPKRCDHNCPKTATDLPKDGDRNCLKTAPGFAQIPLTHDQNASSGASTAPAVSSETPDLILCGTACTHDEAMTSRGSPECILWATSIGQQVFCGACTPPPPPRMTRSTPPDESSAAGPQQKQTSNEIPEP